MALVSPPRSGRVVLQGSAFTYVPRNDFQGEDSFDLEVAGQIQKVQGASTIHIVVSVRGNCLLQNNPMQSTVHGSAVGNRVEDRRVRDGETLRLLKAGTWAAD
jgi:hypothetical protein